MVTCPSQREIGHLDVLFQLQPIWRLTPEEAGLIKLGVCVPIRIITIQLLLRSGCLHLPGNDLS